MQRPNIWLAASALAIAACTSTQTAPDAPATVAVAVASADQIAGRDVYGQFCSACHNGGDETAPELDELHGLGAATRSPPRLSPGGLMALQSGMLNDAAAQRMSSPSSPRRPRRTRTSPTPTSAPIPPAATAAPMSTAFPIPRAASATNATAPMARARPPGPRPSSATDPSSSNPGNSATCTCRVVTRGLTSPRAIEFLPDRRSADRGARGRASHRPERQARPGADRRHAEGRRPRHGHRLHGCEAASATSGPTA